MVYLLTRSLITREASMHWKFWFCLASLSVFSFAGSAIAQTPPIRDLLAIEHDLNTMCRGWAGDDPHTGEVCDVRDKIDKLLGALGYCHGKKDQSDSQMQWHKCTRGSLEPFIGLGIEQGEETLNRYSRSLSSIALAGQQEQGRLPTNGPESDCNAPAASRSAYDPRSA